MKSMPTIDTSTRIAAPIELVFDLSRSVELHVRSESGRGEEAVAGKTSGLVGMGDWVTWRARHLGMWRTLTSKVVAFERPNHFRDSMTRGAFARFDHDHYFAEEEGVTVMRDVFDFSSPLGPIGALVDALFLRRYMAALVDERVYWIKRVAESEEWREYLDGPGEPIRPNGAAS